MKVGNEEINVGDTIILTGSYWRGCEGVVTEISPTQRWLRTDFLDGRKFQFNQVRLLDPNEENPREKFY